jgi:hypothetical protein
MKTDFKLRYLTVKMRLVPFKFEIHHFKCLSYLSISSFLSRNKSLLKIIQQIRISHF